MYILFDIGGTKMRIARSKDAENFDEPVILDTPENFEEGINLIQQTVAKISEGQKITAAAGGVTGTFNKERSRLMRSPNLQGWVGNVISERLSGAIGGAPVYVENDAAIVGLGEAMHGAGKGFQIVSYFTVSTGVGGARIVDGHIDEHVYGFEPGQITIDSSGTTLEETVSGTAIFHRFGKKPKEIPQESPVWEELAHSLALGLHDSLVQWSPDVIVLGGSMIVGDPYIDVHRVEYYLKEVSHVFPTLPFIKKAKLGAVGGIHGALVFLKQKINK